MTVKMSIMLTSAFFVSFSLVAKQENDFCVYAIPGINWRGSEPEYIREVLQDETITVISVENPPGCPDLGQSHCIEQLERAFLENPPKSPVILYATSQGTATALNYFVHVDKGKFIKALILEGSLGSGNSAICHTLKGSLMNRPGIVNLPLSYYWLPYFAKKSYPFYWPSGKQAIKSVNDMENFDVPIILIHSKDDQQVAFDDACALYSGLCKKNKNVYFIQKEGSKHINILMEPSDRQIVQAIIEKHGFVKNGNDQIDLRPYQPDPGLFEEKYIELVSKERKHVYLGYTLVAGFCAIVAAAAYGLYAQYLE